MVRGDFDVFVCLFVLIFIFVLFFSSGKSKATSVVTLMCKSTSRLSPLIANQPSPFSERDFSFLFLSDQNSKKCIANQPLPFSERDFSFFFSCFSDQNFEICIESNWEFPRKILRILKPLLGKNHCILSERRIAILTTLFGRTNGFHKS